MRLPYSLVPEKIPYQILLLSLLVMLLYYPAIFAEISLIDDLDMVNSLLNTEKLNFVDLFVPRSASGGYYRPILSLSQYIDKQIWMMSSSFMHIENILFHLINVLLVYTLTLQLSGRLSFKIHRLVPFIAALLFAVHPIATESVNWISGRTDTMACNFILISAIFLFRYRGTRKKRALFYSGSALLLALFTKEVAFGYILALPFLFSLSSHDASKITEPEKRLSPKRYNPLVIFMLFFSVSTIIVLYTGFYWSVMFSGFCYLFYLIWPDIRKKTVWETFRGHASSISVLILCVFMACILFFVLRKIAFSSDIDRISNTMRLIYQDTGYAISIFLGAAGFYVKKFFFPLPLNFFIFEIDPLYDLIGIAVFLFAIWLAQKRTTISALSIVGMCCVLPVFPFAFGTIAWTGYAERYIYIASAFWSIAVTLFAVQVFYELKIHNAVKTLIYTGTLIIFTTMTFFTYQRNIVWQTNMTLIADTVTQNPRQKKLRGLYMLAFIRAGDFKSAREQYKIISSLYSNKYLDIYDVNMAGIEASVGNKAEAEALLQKVLSTTKGKSSAALKFYITFQENELKEAKDQDCVRSVQDKLITLYNQSYQLNHDPFIFYRLGQIYITRNEREHAVKMFERVVKEYPPGNMYRENSVKIIQKLNNGVSHAKGASL